MISIQPIATWPRKPAAYYKSCRFDSTYSATVDLLEKELDYLKAASVALQLWLKPEDIRIDGQMRANVQPSKPGVILAFTGKHGHVTMPCDTYSHWHHNLRAVALSLQALRTVDRYGVTTGGEQYKGWKALPSGIEVGPATMTVEEAAKFLSTITPFAAHGSILTREHFQGAYRAAALKLHPDAGGDRDQWDKLQRAKEILNKHHGIS